MQFAATGRAIFTKGGKIVLPDFITPNISAQWIGSPSVTVTDENIKDLRRRRTTATGADYVRQYRIAGNDGVSVGSRVTLSSLTPAICTAYASGEIRFAGTPGLGQVLARAEYIDGHVLEQVLSVDFSVVSGGVSETLLYLGWAAGTLASHSVAAVDTRIAGKTPASAKPLYSSINHSAPAYVRNPAVWCADIDLTCVPVWNSGSGQAFNGALITTQALICAAHAAPGIGATVRFVATDNTIVIRTITAGQTHPSYMPYYPDIRVLKLDSPVPASITPTKLLPSTWAPKLPTLGNLNGARPTECSGVPCICLDQEMKALVTDCSNLATNLGSVGFGVPLDATRLSFYEDKISGDSGSAAFLIINGAAVLVTVWTFGGAGSGTFFASHATAIQAMLTSLSAGTLATADLSAFPSP